MNKALSDWLVGNERLKKEMMPRVPELILAMLKKAAAGDVEAGKLAVEFSERLSDQLKAEHPDYPQRPDPGKQLLTAQEAAYVLNISVRSVSTLEKLGRIPPRVEFGDAVRWSLPVLNAWLRDNCPPWDQWQAMEAEGKRGRR